MEDSMLTKVSPTGEWVNINLSEMARLLQAANPDAKVVTTGKGATQDAGMKAATKDRNITKGRNGR